MSFRERLLRVGIGLLVIALVAFVGILFVQQLIPTWGATASEVARNFPGDELLTNPSVNWTHAITINAPPEKVWGWVAQIGERRGAFYSYTFIENQMGNGDVYHNADRIVPEWQNPKPGDSLIGGALAMNVAQVETGKWMLASSTSEMGWTWVWYLEPVGANQTRLLVRMKLQPSGMTSNPIVDTGIGLGAFIMELNMLQGIQMRAEGNIPPAYSELLEIGVWLLAFAAGVVAAVFFVTFKEWRIPLLVGILTIPVLFLFLFWQPPIWTRLIAALALWAGVLWFVLNESQARTWRSVPRDYPGPLTLKPLT